MCAKPIVRQLLWHRQRLVQMRTRVVNQLHAVALNEGLRRKKSLWRSGGRAELECLSLAPWSSRRRQDLLRLLDELEPKIAELTASVQREVERRPEAQLLMTHPGVGAIRALAFVLVVGDPGRFPNGKKLSGYLGLVPSEESSGDRRRLGHISKQGNSLLRLLDELEPRIGELTASVQREAERHPEAQLLMSHPGVGAITALAFVLILGDPGRFTNGKKLASYLGLVPSEESSGDRRRLGHISKQGNSLLRFLLVEAAQAAVRSDPEWRRRYLHLAMRRERRIAKVAMARKLAVSLLWMWRNSKFGSHVGQPGTALGA